MHCKNCLIIFVILVSLFVFLVPAVNSFVNNPYVDNKEVSEEDVLELLNEEIRGYIVSEKEKSNGAFIEPEVYSTIEENGSAMVIV
ncbi:MAG: hypothetical protein AABX94_02760, partial [Nanoarchaeota archaeon]